MNDGFWYLISAAATASLAVMFFVWLLAKRVDNAGIVDVAWSLGFALIALICLLIGQGDGPRSLLIFAMVAIWSLRLGGYLWVRVAKHHPEEDGRYAALREQYPRHTWLMFLGFFQLQAVLLVVLSVPFAMVSSNPQAGLSMWEWAGAAIWLIAICGESLADFQLHRFRSQPGNKGKTCKTGLWRLSRHPNYFFEWLVWVAYFVFALGTPDGWITVYCPALMLFFLFKVTGIPATEAQALKSRGDEYHEYQRTTSAFVPWFPRKSP
jgi:steroid 5-alpha reductase family enzyme